MNEDVVYLMDVYWARSTNGGRSFTTYSAPYVDHHDMAILPDRIYMGNDAGFYRSGDGGTNWFHSPSMAVTQFYDLGIDPVDPRRRFGGTQDNGSERTTDGGLSNWGISHYLCAVSEAPLHRDAAARPCALRRAG